MSHNIDFATLNNAITNVAPNTGRFAGYWRKKVITPYWTRYFKNATHSVTIPGIDWGEANASLPTEVGNFDQQTMAISASCVNTDNAVTCSCATKSGWSSVKVQYCNSYSGSVTTTLNLNIVLDVFS